MDIHGQVAQRHRDAVLRALRDGRARTRSELSRELHIARSTISEILSSLIDEGSVLPTTRLHPAKAGRGRPAEVLTLDPAAGHCIGLDFSHHRVVAVIVNATREIIATRSTTYAQPDTWPARTQAAIALIAEMADRHGIHYRSLQVIAVGLPGPNSIAWAPEGRLPEGVDQDFRRVGRAITHDFTDHFGVPTVVDHHIRFAALAESTWDRPRPLDNLIYLRLSKGVGGAIITGGSIARGAHATAGELGHVVVDHSDAARECRCGRRGCLETLVSIDGILATAADHGGDYTDLASLGTAIAHDDAAAVAALDSAARQVGVVLGLASLLIDPAEIVLAGECSTLAPDFSERVQRHMTSATLPYGPRPTVRAATFHGQAGAIGAALAAIQAHHRALWTRPKG